MEGRALLANWIAAGPAPQQDTHGLFAGPGESVTGRVSALAFGQYNGQTALYLGAAGGGVWRSTNYDSATPTWVPLTDNLGVIDPSTGLGSGSMDVGSIAYDSTPDFGQPTPPGQTIYVGTGEANYSYDSRYGSGILKSTDGGDSWSLASSGPNNAFFGQSISKIIVDPTNQTGNRLYAAVVPSSLNPVQPVDGIYESIDGGSDWTQIAGGSTAQIGPSIDVTDMDYTESSDGTSLTLFAGVRGSSPSNPNPNPDGTVSGIYQSTNGGGTWARLAITPTPAPPALSSPSDLALRRVALAADHTPGGTTVYAAEVQTDGSLLNVYKTTDNGTTWNATTSPTNVTGTIGWYSLALGLSASGQVFIGGASYPRRSTPQNGVMMSSDGGTSWTSIDLDTSGRGTHTDLHAFAFQGSAVYVGGDGGIFKYGGGPGWADLNTAGLQTNQLYGIALSPADPKTMLEGSQDNGIALTTDGGKSWDSVASGDGGFVRFDPYDGNRAYKMGEYGKLSYSDDGGNTWSTMYPDGEHDDSRFFPFITPFAVDPVRGNTSYIIVGAKGTVWQYKGGWTDIGRPNGIVDSAAVTAVAWAPSDDKTIFVGFADGKIWRTQDGGSSWGLSGQPAGYIGPVTDLAVDPINATVAYATISAFNAARNDGQVYQLLTNGTWDPINNFGSPDALPNVPANTIVLDPNNGNRIYVGNDVGVYQGDWQPGNATWDWTRMGTSLPNVQVLDLQIQQYAKTTVLAAATHGRGAWLIPVTTVKVSNIPTPMSDPQNIAVAPDGSIWFTELNTSRIGMIDPATGDMSEYYSVDSEGHATNPYDITVGPDGSVWFTEGGGGIGRLDPSTGHFTYYQPPGGIEFPNGITVGSDGGIWFTNPYSTHYPIGRLDPTSGQFTFYRPPSGSYLGKIVSGPDGALWFTEEDPNVIGRIDPTTGQVSEFLVANSELGNMSITAGPDNALWFTVGAASEIGRIDATTHDITYVSVPNFSGLDTITTGPDGGIWFIGGPSRIDPVTDTITEYGLPAGEDEPGGIVEGSDGSIWFTLPYSNQIAQLIINPSLPEDGELGVF